MNKLFFNELLYNDLFIVCLYWDWYCRYYGDIDWV